MPQPGQRVLAGGHDLPVHPHDADAVDIQLDLPHGLHGRAKRRDVVFEINEGGGDAVGIPDKLLQLCCQGLRGRDLIRFLTRIGHRFIDDLIQPFALKIHGLDHFRIDPVDVVVTECIGVHACEDQDPAVDLVEPVHAVVKLPEDIPHAPQRRLKAQRLPAGCQVKEEFPAVLIAEHLCLPVVGEGKGDLAHLVKGQDAVDGQ